MNTTITSLTLGNSSGPQTLSVNGKTLTLNGPGASTIDNNGVLDFNGGTLTGGGDLTVNGAFNWTGGTMSGSGTTSIAYGGTLTLSGGSTKTLSGRTVDNAGTATLSNTGEFDLRNGVVFTNQAGGTFDAQSDAFIDHGFGTAPTFSNNGTFKKSGGTGTTTFEPVFNNTGVVQVQSGTLDLTGGGTSSGSFDAASGTTLDFGGGTHTLNTGATFTGAGSSRVVGGTATVNGAATAANFAQTGGTLNGGNTLTVSGTFNWTGGTMSGSGTTSIASGGTLTFSGGSTKTLSGRTIDNAGTAILKDAGEFDLRDGAVFINQAGGVFDAQSDAFIDHGFGTVPTFNNSGTFKKSGGTGTTTLEPVFNNTGVVQVQSGTLDLTGGGTSSGSFDAASGTTLDFGSGTHTLNTGATFTGAGPSRVVGGTATVNGATTAANFAQSGGTLNGTDTLTISGTFNWTGGTMSGSGTTSIASGGTLTFSGSSTKTLSVRTVDNAGTVNLIDTGQFDLRNGAVFTNQAGGVFDAQSDAFMDHGFGTVPTFNNNGTFKKSGGTGTTTFEPIFNNTGAVQVQSGTLDLTGGGTSSGSFDAASGTTLDFGSGTHTLNAGTAFTGAGPSRVTGATVTVNGAATAASFELNSGTLNGTDTLTVSSAFNWTGGTMSGSGKTSIAAGGTMTFSGGNTKTLSGRTVDNAGTVNLTGTGQFDLRNGAVFNNLSGGVFDAQGDAFIDQDLGAAATFNNAGTLKKSGGTGTTTFEPIFNNTGSVQVQSGTLKFTLGGGTSSGSFDAVSGTTLDFGSGTHTLNAGTAFTGAGSSRVTGATVTVNGAVSAVNFGQTAGTLGGGDTLTVTGTFGWTGGTMSGSGKTSIAAGGTMTLSGGNTKSLSGRTIDNAGTVNLTGTGQFDLRNGGVFNNLSGGVFDAQSDAFIDQDLGAAATFNNAGTLKKSGGTGTTTFEPVFNNTGSVQVQSGTLNLTVGGGTSSGSFDAALGTTLDFGSGTHPLDAGATFTGAVPSRVTGGTVTVNGAVSAVNFGQTGGTLDGADTLTVTGTFNWAGGTMGGSGVTSIAAGGAMTLSGGNIKSLSGRTIDNAGVVNLTGTGQFDLRNGAVFNNLSGGVFDAQSDALVDQDVGAAATFNNTGIFKKSGGTATTLESVFNNTGSVQVQSGTLNLTVGGGTSSGSFDTASGTTLDFGSGTHTLDAGATFTGAGPSRVTGGTVTVNGAVSAVNFGQTGGTLDGGDTLTVTGTFSWTGGTMSGSGKTSIAAGGAMTLSGGSTKTLSLRTVDNTGTVNLTGTGQFDLRNGAVFNNLSGGVFDAQSDALVDQDVGAAATFNNTGIFKKSGGTATTLEPVFNNTGSVQVQSGTLNLTVGGGTSSGSFDAASGTTLDFGSGTHTLDAGATFTGAGPSRVTGGTVTVNGAVSAVNFGQTGGTLDGGNTLTISGTFNWTGGTMGGSGKTSIAAGGTMTLSGGNTKSLSGRTIDNAGTVNLTGTGQFDLRNGAVFNNLSAGVFDTQSDALVDQDIGAATTFNNSGTFKKSGGTGATTFEPIFNNGGTAEVQSGTLNFTAAYTQTAGVTLLNGGNLTSSQTLDIQGGTLSGAGTLTANVTSSGQVAPGGSAGTLQMLGNYTQAAGGSLEVEIGGLVAGTDFDVLDISSSATLDGTLNVSLISGFNPSQSDSFQILNYAARSGAFSTVSLPTLATGLEWENITYGSDSVVLMVVASNTPPTISDILDQSTNEDTPTPAIPFTIGDAETPAGSLTLTASSDNQTLVPDGNVVLGGADANRTVTVTPASDQFGSTTITVTVDDGADTTSDTFVLTVTALNDPPTIFDILDQNTDQSVPTAAIPFTIGDVETAAGSLTLTGSSDNQTLVPDGNIVFGGTDANRTVTITPALNQAGNATITVNVSDETDTASDTFVLTVNPKPVITADPSPIDFGDVIVAEPTPLTVSIGNTGNADLTVTSITPAPGGILAASGFSAPFTIAPSGPAQEITLALTASTPGLISGTLTIVSDDPNSPTTVNIAADAKVFTFTLDLSSGLNMISMPLKPLTSLTAETFAALLVDATLVIRYDTTAGKFKSFVTSVTLPTSPDNFPIDAEHAYIVNMSGARTIQIQGTPWGTPAAPLATGQGINEPHRRMQYAMHKRRYAMKRAMKSGRSL